MLSDLRTAARALVRAPGYLLTAVLTLALGVGATTALFTVVDAVLLRPLPYAEPQRLVSVWPGNSVPDALYEQLRAEAAAYGSLAAYGWPSEVSILAGDEPARVVAAPVTDNLFATLGVRALHGRVLTAEDTRGGAAPVAVVSHEMWRDRLGGDPAAVGRTVTVDGVARRVVGVMPPSFAMPSPRVAVWTPARIDPSNVGAYWWSWRLNLVGRLAPGVTPDRATAETRAAVMRAGQERFPTKMNADYGQDLAAVPLQEALVGDSRSTLRLLLGAVLATLLVAVVNVAGLTLVRAAGRAREVTVRAAMGASRTRLVRQLVAEGLVVAGAAAALGAGLAWGLTRVVLAAVPREGPGALPRAEEIGVDGRALAFAALVAVAAGVASSLAPAFAATGVNLRRALADDGGARGATGGRARRRTLETLVGLQVALGVVLAAGAGLVATSLVRLRAVDPGFRAERVTVAEVPAPASAEPAAPGAPRGARQRAFYDALLARARALPDVQRAALASSVPFASARGTGVFDLEAHPRVEGGDWKTVDYTTLTPGAIGVLGIPLVGGRDLADADRAGAPPVGLVDVTAVRRYWPEFAADPRRAIGQRVSRPGDTPNWITIVGVVGAVRRDSLSAEPRPTLYLPAAQDFPVHMRLVLRGTAGPEQLAPALRRVVRELEPSVPVGTVRALDGFVADSAARQRFVTGVLAAFALGAVLLGAVGVYGVAAFAVARRTREIGVRSALGASPPQIRALVLRDGARMAIGGIVLGLAGALATAGTLRAFLFGVDTVEPLVLGAVSVALLLVVLAASALPARRASRVDPLVALRTE